MQERDPAHEAARVGVADRRPHHGPGSRVRLHEPVEVLGVRVRVRLGEQHQRRARGAKRPGPRPWQRRTSGTSITLHAGEAVHARVAVLEPGSGRCHEDDLEPAGARLGAKAGEDLLHRLEGVRGEQHRELGRPAHRSTAVTSEGAGNEGASATRTAWPTVIECAAASAAWRAWRPHRACTPAAPRPGRSGRTPATRRRTTHRRRRRGGSRLHSRRPGGRSRAPGAAGCAARRGDRRARPALARRSGRVDPHGAAVSVQRQLVARDRVVRRLERGQRAAPHARAHGHGLSSPRPAWPKAKTSSIRSSRR